MQKITESILPAEEQRKSGKCLKLVREEFGENEARKAVIGE